MTSKSRTASCRPRNSGSASSSAQARPPSRRAIEVFRGAWGAALLISPAVILEQFLRARADSRSIAVARVLGARHLAQAALSGIRPTPAVLAMGVWVDVAHASTALMLACADPARARAATTDAAVAAGWAAAGFRELTHAERPLRAGGKWRDRHARSVLRHLPAGRRRQRTS